jgi:hypothetical protein
MHEWNESRKAMDLMDQYCPELTSQNSRKRALYIHLEAGCIFVMSTRAVLALSVCLPRFVRLVKPTRFLVSFRCPITCSCRQNRYHSGVKVFGQLRFNSAYVQ